MTGTDEQSCPRCGRVLQVYPTKSKAGVAQWALYCITHRRKSVQYSTSELAQAGTVVLNPAK